MEFENVFRSLFKNPTRHFAITNLFGERKTGMTREDVYAWRAPVKAGGAQIDMVIDRGDRMINVCEMKYTSEDYSFSLASRATQMAR